MPLLARSVGLPMLPSDRNAWASGNQASSAPGTNGKKLAARNGLIKSRSRQGAVASQQPAISGDQGWQIHAKRKLYASHGRGSASRWREGYSALNTRS